MAIPAERRGDFIKLDRDSVPVSEKGEVLTDLYVELPNNERFIRYIANGSPLEDYHLNNISRHSVPSFFALITDMEETHIPSDTDSSDTISHTQNQVFASDGKVHDLGAGPDRKVFKGSTQSPDTEDTSERHTVTYTEEDLKGGRRSIKKEDAEIGMVMQFGKENAEFLKKPIAQELKKIFNESIDSAPGQLSLEDTPVAELSQKLLKAIAPEIDNFRSHLKKIPQYVGVMDDSAAMTAISTLVAIARGQSSRSIFKDLSYACLFMDFSLLDVSTEEWKTYYLEPSKISDALEEKIFNHPRRSYDIVQKKFKNLPDIVGQMILGHHELFNGKGYPRQIRSELVAPLVRILAFAVDIFEFMKRAHMRGQSVPLNEAVEYYLNEPVEPHLRRHGLTLCREVLEFLNEGDLTS